MSPNSPSATVIRLASTVADIETARSLFIEYATWLNIDLCFQGFDNELAMLPGDYAPPSGRLLLAESGQAAGCVALRSLDEDDDRGNGNAGSGCELKRLWVRPQFRKQGLGHALTAEAIAAARAIGYRSMYLDTMPAVMPNAVAMYRTFGFAECDPYYHNPTPGVIYMRCAL